MINQKIGSFIAQLRKDHGMTQEQLAEKIGVSNRSISRWENGNTLPDYGLLQSLSTVLNVSIAELLAGQRLAGNPCAEDLVSLALELAQREKKDLRRSLNLCFGTGLAFLAAGTLLGRFASEPVIFFLLCIALGLAFISTGFLTINRKTPISKEQVNILTAGNPPLHMKTANEMLQFTKIHQIGHKKQHTQAFIALEAELASDEYARYAFIADSCTINNAPGPWHISTAITNKRILFAGETVRGRILTATTTDSYALVDLNAIQAERNRLFFKFHNATIKLEGDQLDRICKEVQNCL